MEIVWLCILAFMFIMFAILDGFDFGAGMLDLFLAKNEKESTMIKRSIGPFWDGNEVWLIAAGGLLFMAFPKLYASFFSGFYLPLMLLLWLIMGRAISLEIRNQLDDKIWKAIWDKLFGVSSLLLALVFGIAYGNVIRGVNLGGVENGIASYEAHYFFSPLWTDLKSSQNPGVIDWFSLSVGILTVLTFFVHGGNWVILKIDSIFSERIKKTNRAISGVILIAMLVFSFIIPSVNPTIFDNFLDNKILFIIPIVAVLSLTLNVYFQAQGKELISFICTSLFIAGMFASGIIGIFPAVLPSTNDINPDLTIYNTSNQAYGLNIGVTWWILGITLITGYSFMVHWIYRGKISNDEGIYQQYH